MLDLLDQDFISNVLNMFQNLKKIMRMMYHRIENIDSEIEIIIRNQMEILELKITITEIKISLGRLNSTFKQTEERISQCESGLIEIIQSEVQKEKKKEEKLTAKVTCRRPSRIPTYA